MNININDKDQAWIDSSVNAAREVKESNPHQFRKALKVARDKRSAGKLTKRSLIVLERVEKL